MDRNDTHNASVGHYSKTCASSLAWISQLISGPALVRCGLEEI